MIITGPDGVRVISKSAHYTSADDARFDKRFGVGGWRYAENICSYLSPECGYGEPLNKQTCSYCDGRCLRMKG